MKFTTAQEWLALAEQHNLTLAEVVIRAEAAASELAVEQIMAKMRQNLLVMEDSVKRGLTEPVYSRSGLTGGAAFQLMQALKEQTTLTSCLYLKAAMYALSTAEVNASMGRICAAPTAGAAGVVPGVIIALGEALQLDQDQLLAALFVAAGVGQVAAENAQLVGAALGCQAEIGVAAAMAAAGGAFLAGCSALGCLDAASLALQNLLGLTCDPVAGYVEIPCISRNSAAAVNALICIELAKAGVSSKIPLDDAVLAMIDIGKRMHPDLRETSRGGLAVTPTGKLLAQQCESNCRFKQEN
ncbi:MAG: L-serine ammonia-lyase, iron-sulfur-dependent, subunit alpha [Firmicutes bacterium]|nr:L-serine ammonia-lyase, iron-sulfur-dependent, subunit alpha [Bacillota bacterium]